ncbi:hypothetical protein M430DRAFT_37771 [Amorphotheca resinae ATCC 22711]|uniref:Uncharacterized protein n=1 Tax=Amorphotheca resinae ATCC 22711 TaxID=857342 RepID=A0A2T3AP35_AMORE|nr:hypothetical protein M430DRAFT_37771 [Amorphotheca resinae ATCC 22711]PSS06688.1 hypothetical protein M430DRAFT_37771 [Amorphotheca resinae ATCC 22711]
MTLYVWTKPIKASELLIDYNVLRELKRCEERPTANMGIIPKKRRFNANNTSYEKVDADGCCC